MFRTLFIMLLLFNSVHLFATNAHGDLSELFCKQNVQLSLNQQGDTPIPPQVILSGTHPDYSRFVVEIIDPPVGNNIATCDMVGDEISVMVTDTITNNSCWSTVLIEDKLAPTFDCETLYKPCTFDLSEDDPQDFLPNLYDNCTAVEDLDIWYSETITNLNCNTGYTAQINRVWHVTDEEGNEAICDQIIYLEQPELSDVEFPDDIDLECPYDSPDPSITGEPELDGMPIVALCSLLVWHEDDVSSLCGGAEKITRTWSVMNWCTGETIEHDQIIQLLDNEPPVLNCPHPSYPVIVPTVPGECYGFYTIPSNLATDACAYDGAITYDIEIDGMPVGGGSAQVDLGEHEVKVTATDPCGNSSMCTYNIEVKDLEEPSMVCLTTSIALGNQTEVRVGYRSFMGYFSDNCGILDTMIRRMEFCSDPTDLNFGDSVSFCCDDVGEDVMVVIKVRDINGNMQTCMINVEVQDLFPPEITCPADVTIECTDLGDPGFLGSPTASDNCNFTIDSMDEVNLDNCLQGVILRTYTATDDFGNSASCVQEITVENPFDFEIDSVTWPQDTVIEACDVDPDPDSLGLVPTLNVPQCDNLTLFHTDSIPNPDSVCLVIFRTWTVYDSCDMVGLDSTQLIIIKNNAPPELSGPDDVIINTDENSCDQLVDLDPVTTTDCSFGVTVVNDYNAQGADINDVFPIGVTDVVFTATDGCGNTSTFEVTVTIIDDVPPVIDCPDDFTVDNDPGICGADVIVPLPDTSDNCGVASVSNDYTGVFDASAFYPVGSTTVTWVITDIAGNSAMCTTVVTVEDSEPPTVTCPGNVTMNNDPGVCGADVTISLPDTSDNCAVVSITNDFNGLMNASDFYPVGTTVVTYTATDAAGNTSTCTFTVTVIDNEDPVIDCPEDIVQGNDPGECGADVIVPLPDTSDNCGVASVTNDYNNLFDASDFYPVGTTVVTWTITDLSGNVASCSTEITVNDTEDPVIDCPDNITVDNDPGVCQADVTVPLPDTSDNCGVASVTNDYNGAFDASDIYPVGSTVVTWTITDDSGNSSTCSTTIIVNDTEDPVIDCPDDITMDAGTDACEADVVVPLPDTSDNCGVATVTNDYTGVFDASGTYPVGITTVTWTITDVNGNTSQCSITVTVIDNNSLAIDCPDDITMDNDPGVCGADVIIPLPDTSDNCGVASVTNDYNGQYDASDFYPVGVTVVTWTITDLSGNMETCSTTITVNDVEDPVIDCPDDVTAENDPGVCEADVLIPLPDTSDNCSVASVTNDYNGLFDASDVYPVGSTVVTWTITDDSGNTATCSTTITVNDTEDPVIDCPDDITVNNDPGVCEADVDVPLPDTSDNCAVATVTNDYNGLFDASDIYPVGTTIVTWTITDASGNTSTCSTSITVEDTEPPVITCPDDLTVGASDDGCDVFVSIDIPDVSDDCGVDTLFNDITGTPDASGVYPAGTTTITWTVIDIGGLSATCSITVTVVDTIPPTIDCPDNITVDNDPGVCEADVDVPLPDTSDNCGVASVINDFNGGFDASGIYPVGETIVTWVITDDAGNVDSCMTTITVIDTEAPEIISCPQDITIACDSMYDNLSVFGEPEATDNCDLTIIADSIFNVDDCNGTGTITRTWLFIDDAGNADSCMQVITVNGGQGNGLDSLSFIWPPSIIEIDFCDATDPEDIPGSAPILDPAIVTCSVFGIEFMDSIDVTDPVGCVDIIREWTVTDSCEFDPATGEGQWIFTQQIIRIDTILPEFTSFMVSDTFFVPSDTCVAFATISASATDCSGVTITNNSPFSIGGGPVASGDYPLGETVVTFIAEDGCGNVDSVQTTVVVLDTIPPEIECVKVLYLIEDDLMVDVPVSDLIVSATDNCTDSADLIATFDPFDPDLDTLTFGCADIAEIDLLVYLVDGSGNFTFCFDTIGVDDPNNFCGPVMMPIAGLITDPSGDAVRDVDVIFNTSLADVTDNEGYFYSEMMHRYEDVTVVPRKNDDPLEGVTTYDLALMQRHILGLSTFNSAYQYVAADVNQSSTVDIIDIIELRKLILGIYDDFPQNTSWRFVDKNYDLSDVTNPLLVPLKETIEYLPLSKHEMQTNFIGVKIGDIDGSDPNRSAGYNGEFKSIGWDLKADKQDANAYYLELGIRELAAWEGFQGAIKLSADWSVRDIDYPVEWFQAANISRDQNTLKMSWNSSGGFTEGNVFLRIHLKSVVDNPNITAPATMELREMPAEAYDREMGSFYGLTLASDQFDDQGSADPAYSYQLLQNVPNPFRNSTQILYQLPADQEIKLEVLDAKGQLIWNRIIEGSKGMNAVSISRNELPIHGILYYRLTTEEFTATKKMILLD